MASSTALCTIQLHGTAHDTAHSTLYCTLNCTLHSTLHTALHDSEGSAQSGAALCDVTLAAAAELAANTEQLCTKLLRIARHRTA